MKGYLVLGHGGKEVVFSGELIVAELKEPISG